MSARVFDFQIQNEGSIFLFTALTATGRAWEAERIPEDALRFGSAFVVEHRYASDIIEGILRDGLKVTA